MGMEMEPKLLDLKINIDKYPQIKLGTEVFEKKEKAYLNTVNDLRSVELRQNLAYLFNYELNGLCRIDWEGIQAYTSDEVILVQLTGKKRKEIESLNPTITQKIKDKFKEAAKDRDEGKN